MKLRGQVCNGSRTESSLLYIVKRITGISGAEVRVTSLLSSTLLSMPLPEMFLKLSPIFVLSKPKLVAATSEADSIAAQFSTTELMKTKPHLVAGESILNTDGENHRHGYDQLAKGNITTESTDVYSTVLDRAPVRRRRDNQARMDPRVLRSIEGSWSHGRG